MSTASDELEQKTDGEVPTVDHVIAATADEAAQAVRGKQAQFEAKIRGEPLRSVAIAAGAGFLAAILLRRH